MASLHSVHHTSNICFRFENEKLEYEAQIRKLQTEKADYEDRVHNLTSDLELKQLELNQFKGKIGELENQVLTKTWAMDREFVHLPIL